VLPLKPKIAGFLTLRLASFQGSRPLPPYMRRSKSIETLLPILYLKGISTGDFSEALAALLGKDAPGLSASAIGRLKEGWQDDHATVNAGVKMHRLAGVKVHHG